MSDYYDRRGGVNSDGTPLFCVDKDKANERTVVAELEKKWACEIREYGPLCPLDYYVLKDGRMVGVIEIKSRTHEAGKYPDVYLNVRKWYCLGLSYLVHGCAALFVVRFLDSIRYIPFNKIQGILCIAGCDHIVKSHTDIEPVIRVPIADMKIL